MRFRHLLSFHYAMRPALRLLPPLRRAAATIADDYERADADG